MLSFYCLQMKFKERHKTQVRRSRGFENFDEKGDFAKNEATSQSDWNDHC